MASLLETQPLRKPAHVHGEAAILSLGLPSQEQYQLKTYLGAAPDPDAAIHYLLSLKQRSPEALERLAHSPSGLQYFVTVASFSRFLSEEILQNPQWLEEVSAMNRLLTAGEYKKRLGKFLKDPAERALALSLALFRRQQILRILLRDVLGLIWWPGTANRVTWTRAENRANAGCR
jgi:glutamine synthetase adenylyltransferase